ncbi:MAG: SMC family ATPase [Chloroflexi bacterium]|nr:SMC family ATPase [Chloroflexota bacterium]
MIPVKLNLRNFLSYRENVPSLDFTGVHVACLCGDNGHGKSALLDAITWCLWGKARGQVQDDLVSYGADEARVELDFLARDSCYRAVRSRRRGGGRRRQGSGDLQLLVLGEGGTTPQVISGNTVRETQARIEHLVGMDYDTFINSAFLLQGRADEFTNKSPAERKAVLSSILGLEYYDRYQVKARERAAARRSDTDRLAGFIQQTQAEIDNLGDPAAELEGVNLHIVDLEDGLSARRTTIENLREKVSDIQRIRERLDENAGQRSRIRDELEQIRLTIASAETRLNDHRSLVQESEIIGDNFTSLQRAREVFSSLESARHQHEILQAEHSRLNSLIEIERVRLVSESERLQQRIEGELTPLVEAEPSLRAAGQQAREKLAALAGREQELSRSRGRLQDLAQAVGEAQTTAARYQAEGEQLNEKLHLLNNVESDARCPLCLSPLSEEGCLRLSESYQQEIEEKRDLYRQNRANLQGLEKQKSELEKAIPSLESELARAGNSLRDQLARVETQLEASTRAGDELREARRQQGELAATLESERFASEARLELGSVRNELQALAYDEGVYRQTYQSIRELEPYAQLKVQLDQALAQLPADEAALRQGKESLASKVADLERLVGQAEGLEAAMMELPRLEMDLQQESSAAADLESQRQVALGRRGLLEGEVNRLKGLRTGLEENRTRLGELQEDQAVYQELANAFGRQGIQAMLIETVVPRLEEETNVLLGRMTDNRMHVKLETQRERRSGAGEPIETLAINVSDELGTRNYEMYSGGEAFRVNLALRIALSRVLSQRTGAPLPTLFIDEGFGTQDASGRERILDVISAIEDDFDKIIVITHLDDLKDMFPTRIEVQKDAGGSTFWLS